MANYLIRFQSNKMAMWVNMPRKYILLDILVCNINDIFYELCFILMSQQRKTNYKIKNFFFCISDKVVKAWQIE